MTTPPKNRELHCTSLARRALLGHIVANLFGILRVHVEKD